MIRKTIGIFLTLCMVLTLMPTSALAANGLPFTDVPEGSWFYDAVVSVNEKELMSGTSSTTFEPLANLTRATVATVLYRMDGKPFVVEEEIFSDVPIGEWYSKAISWAYLNGIVSGYNTNIYGTNDYITREQFAVMMFRFAQYMGYDSSASASLSKFTDAAKVSSWAYEAMCWAVANEIIAGTTPTTLDPGGNSSRAQCAVILMRFINKFETDGTDVDNIFEHLTDLVFIFASGAGGWSTEVEINSDGSFIGYFHDSDMGDSGAGYPDGTYYESSFNGRFAFNKKIDNLTYSIKLVELNVDGVIGEVEIINGVRVITTDAYGFEDAEEFLLYLPGRETADLTEDFLSWVSMPNAWSKIPDVLPFYGLYNVMGQQGFFS